MAGIYIHIPFCKQACYYCNFHFSTSIKHKESLINSIITELQLRKQEFNKLKVETIYFGGGTPSLLTIEEFNSILNTIYKHYHVIDNPEITLEANPDDLSSNYIKTLSRSSVNRLSIGIQSFFDTDLKLMNRAHNSLDSRSCLDNALNYFENISIDLIYGIPNASNKQWQKNIDLALLYNVPHISAYALTVEPKTALANYIEKELIPPTNDTKAQEQFYMLIDALENDNFVHYELSNFGKESFFSKNNSAYWQGKSYIGIGPSAHSFNGESRSWNISNNAKYIKSLNKKQLPSKAEILTTKDQYNEYVMTGLRTIWGVNINKVESRYGFRFKQHITKLSKKYIDQGLLEIKKDNNQHQLLKATKEGKFLIDGIASHLFMV